jgi:hypothetical protein
VQDHEGEDSQVSGSALAGIGCLTAIAGTFGGGMIAVLIAKFVGSIRGCQPAEGLPACDWHLFAGAGMLVGFVGLPLISIWRLKSRRSA